MLNWIVLYLTNMLLTTVKEDASPYTKVLAHTNASAVLPSLGPRRAVQQATSTSALRSRCPS